MEPGKHQQIASELVADGSIEFSRGSIAQIRAAAGLLPYRMPVTVPCLPSQPLESRLPELETVYESGLQPVPHIPARHVTSRRALEAFLDRAAERADVRRILLIGGDQADPEGPFATATELLRDGVLADKGIREVGFAAYPEGHPSIPADLLLKALRENIELASDQGMGSYVITQFTLTPQRIPDLCSRLNAAIPGTPVYAGIPGPATHEQLVHFALYCGVSTSLTAVSGVGVRLAQVVDHERSGQQLGLVASYGAAHPAGNLVGVHVYGFGGIEETARWVAARCNP